MEMKKNSIVTNLENPKTEWKKIQWEYKNNIKKNA